MRLGLAAAATYGSDTASVVRRGWAGAATAKGLSGRNEQPGQRVLAPTGLSGAIERAPASLGSSVGVSVMNGHGATSTSGLKRVLAGAATSKGPSKRDGRLGIATGLSGQSVSSQVIASTALASLAFAGLSGRLLANFSPASISSWWVIACISGLRAMDGLALGLVVAVDGLGRRFWPASSLHGLTSLFFAVDGLGQLSLASSLHGLTSGFLPLYAVLADLVDHVDGPAWDVVGLPSSDGLSASAGL